MTSELEPQLTDAAVLVPVLDTAEHGSSVVVIVRTDHGTHGGQLAFPGGIHEVDDADMRATALREAEEEIGLAADQVEIVRALPSLVTLTTNFRIHPFLANIRERPPLWQPDPLEVAEVLEIPLDHLRHPDTHGYAHHDYPGMPANLKLPYFQVGAHRLWGATYRILKPLLDEL